MPDSTPKPGGVFLSYAREDTDAARRIADALRGFGVEVWFDQSELRGGDAWDAKIRGQIKTCALFLPVISTTTQTREEAYFRLEWKLADDRSQLMAPGKPFIVPVVIDDTPEAGAVVPDSFSRSQWTRLAGGEPSSAFIEQVKRLLEAPRKPALKPDLPRPPTLPPEFKQAARDRTAASAGEPAPQKKSAIPGWMWGVLAVAVAGAAVTWSGLRHPAAESPPAQRLEAAATTIKPVPPVKEDKSIAVLPFANMSEDRDSNAFFADGVQEDILTNLSNIHELRVVSRTSVMGYRGTTKTLPQIAQELGVTYILEGSVRRAGNKVRVTGQLIRAATDEHLWAKSFDRDLTDIFAIQSEVAQAIATALQAVISPQEKSLIEQKPTDNIAAYDAYTKARQILSAGSQQNFNDLVPLLKTAVVMDPRFAQAWAELGSVYARRYFDYWERTQEVLDNAKEAIDKAVALAPDDPVVIQKLGDYYYYGLRDYPRASRQYRRLADQYPNYAPAQASLAFIDRRMGRWGEALEGLRRAVKLEPRNLRFSSALVETYTDLRRYDEAEALLREVVAQGGGSVYQKFLLAILAFEKDGSTNEFDRMAEAFAADPKQARFALLLRYRVSRMKGDLASSIQATGQVREMQGPGRYPWEEECNYAMALKIHGDTEQAKALVEARIREERDKVEKQPLPRAWMTLSVAYAVLDNKAEARRCAQAAIDLVPESADATEGVTYTANRALVLAWFGEKDEALAEVKRLLGVPGGLRVEQLRRDPFWKPLQGDPRFEALLNDPVNNAPLF
jgi:TolB-like protein/cytochrome c-type biogenesis protein CcmH/NrfG